MVLNMNEYNQHGVPLWAIKRLLICRINMNESGFQRFDIDDVGNILFNGEVASHIDKVHYDEERCWYYIPVAS